MKWKTLDLGLVLCNCLHIFIHHITEFIYRDIYWIFDGLTVFFSLSSCEVMWCAPFSEWIFLYSPFFLICFYFALWTILICVCILFIFDVMNHKYNYMKKKCIWKIRLSHIWCSLREPFSSLYVCVCHSTWLYMCYFLLFFLFVHSSFSIRSSFVVQSDCQCREWFFF